MAEIAVARPFSVLLDDGTTHSYGPGLHRDVPDAVADHWYTKMFLAPDGKPVDTVPEMTTDERGVAFLVQAKAAAEDTAARLRAELQRITDLWTESDLRARRAEAQLVELGKQPVDNDPIEEATHKTALDDMTAQRDAALARVHQLEADAAKDDHDEAGAKYAVRKKGRDYRVVELDDSGAVTHVVAEGLARADAYTKLEELKAKS